MSDPKISPYLGYSHLRALGTLKDVERLLDEEHLNIQSLTYGEAGRLMTLASQANAAAGRAMEIYGKNGSTRNIKTIHTTTFSKYVGAVIAQVGDIQAVFMDRVRGLESLLRDYRDLITAETTKSDLNTEYRAAKAKQPGSRTQREADVVQVYEENERLIQCLKESLGGDSRTNLKRTYELFYHDLKAFIKAEKGTLDDFMQQRFARNASQWGSGAWRYPVFATMEAGAFDAKYAYDAIQSLHRGDFNAVKEELKGIVIGLALFGRGNGPEAGRLDGPYLDKMFGHDVYTTLSNAQKAEILDVALLFGARYGKAVFVGRILDEYAKLTDALLQTQKNETCKKAYLYAFQGGHYGPNSVVRVLVTRTRPVSLVPRMDQAKDFLLNLAKDPHTDPRIINNVLGANKILNPADAGAPAVLQEVFDKALESNNFKVALAIVQNRDVVAVAPAIINDNRKAKLVLQAIEKEENDKVVNAIIEALNPLMATPFTKANLGLVGDNDFSGDERAVFESLTGGLRNIAVAGAAPYELGAVVLVSILRNARLELIKEWIGKEAKFRTFHPNLQGVPLPAIPARVSRALQDFAGLNKNRAVLQTLLQCEDVLGAVATTSGKVEFYTEALKSGSVDGSFIAGLLADLPAFNRLQLMKILREVVAINDKGLLARLLPAFRDRLADVRTPGVPTGDEQKFKQYVGAAILDMVGNLNIDLAQLRNFMEIPYIQSVLSYNNPVVANLGEALVKAAQIGDAVKFKYLMQYQVKGYDPLELLVSEEDLGKALEEASKSSAPGSVDIVKRIVLSRRMREDVALSPGSYEVSSAANREELQMVSEAIQFFNSIPSLGSTVDEIKANIQREYGRFSRGFINTYIASAHRGAVSNYLTVGGVRPAGIVANSLEDKALICLEALQYAVVQVRSLAAGSTFTDIHNVMTARAPAGQLIPTGATAVAQLESVYPAMGTPSIESFALVDNLATLVGQIREASSGLSPVERAAVTTRLDHILAGHQTLGAPLAGVYDFAEAKTSLNVARGALQGVNAAIAIARKARLDGKTLADVQTKFEDALQEEIDKLNAKLADRNLNAANQPAGSTPFQKAAAYYRDALLKFKAQVMKDQDYWNPAGTAAIAGAGTPPASLDVLFARMNARFPAVTTELARGMEEFGFTVNGLRQVTQKILYATGDIVAGDALPGGQAISHFLLSSAAISEAVKKQLHYSYARIHGLSTLSGAFYVVPTAPKVSQMISGKNLSKSLEQLLIGSKDRDALVRSQNEEKLRLLMEGIKQTEIDEEIRVGTIDADYVGTYICPPMVGTDYMQSRTSRFSTEAPQVASIPFEDGIKPCLKAAVRVGNTAIFDYFSEKIALGSLRRVLADATISGAEKREIKALRLSLIKEAVQSGQSQMLMQLLRDVTNIGGYAAARPIELTAEELLDIVNSVGRNTDEATVRVLVENINDVCANLDGFVTNYLSLRSYKNQVVSTLYHKLVQIDKGRGRRAPILTQAIKSDLRRGLGFFQSAVTAFYGYGTRINNY